MELKFRTITGAIIGADPQAEAPTPVGLADPASERGVGQAQIAFHQMVADDPPPPQPANPLCFSHSARPGLARGTECAGMECGKKFDFRPILVDPLAFDPLGDALGAGGGLLGPNAGTRGVSQPQRLPVSWIA